MGRGVKDTVVNVDLDGVVYDFTGAMRSAFAFRGWEGADEWPDPHVWQTWDVWPISEKDFYEVLYAEVLDGVMFRDGDLVQGAQEGMHRLSQDGFYIRIVTAKTFRNQQVTEKARRNVMWFLSENDLPHDELVFSGPMGKGDFRADIVVDDKPSLDGWVQTGALNLLFDQPWNRTLSTIPDFYERPGWFDRAYSWNDVVELSLNVKSQGVLL